MEIEIIEATSNPMDVMARAAGTSYGKDDAKHGRVATCYRLGHDSILEHASVTFKVLGISRACSHQLVRHRMASYCQLSQRYVKVDTKSDWYVRPPAFESGTDISTGTLLAHDYDDMMHDFALWYGNALSNCIKPEDARYLLPEATKTDITVTMNVRELFHFLDLRTDEHSQWEIRNMANMLVGTIEEAGSQWREVIGMWKEGR